MMAPGRSARPLPVVETIGLGRVVELEDELLPVDLVPLAAGLAEPEPGEDPLRDRVVRRRCRPEAADAVLPVAPSP
jgi:hypothetical protein